MTYIVINKFDENDRYMIDDLESLIRELGEVDLDNGASFNDVQAWFHDNYIVMDETGDISEIN